MGSKFHNGDKKKDKLLLKSYIDFLVPACTPVLPVLCGLWEGLRKRYRICLLTARNDGGKVRGMDGIC